MPQTNDLAQKTVSSYKSIKVSVKLLKFAAKIICGMLTSFGFFVILFILIVVAIVSSKNGFSVTTDYTSFSPSVEQWRVITQNICKEEGIEYYTDVVLAIMQCSTGGGVGDVMRASNKISNELYGHNDGDITNTSYSIKCGVKEIKALLELCNVQDLFDTANLHIMYQAYEYDRGYIDYAKEHGGYAADTAKEYADNNNIKYRSETFAIRVSMYIDFLSGGIKEFENPLAIYSVIKDYQENYAFKLFSGVAHQIVLSSTTGTVVKIDEFENYSNVIIEYEEYLLHYNYISNVNVQKGQEVQKGTTIGMVCYIEEYNDYVMEFGIEKNGEYLNPNDYLGKLMIEKEELDQASIEQGQSIARYAEACIGTMRWKDNGSDLRGCDRIGFIHNAFSTYISSKDEEYYELPTESYAELIESEYVTYKLEQKQYIRPQIMYEGDVIIYEDESSTFCDAAIYIGTSRVVHMTENGAVKDYYNYSTPAVLLRFTGRKNLGFIWPLPGYSRSNITSDFSPDRVNPVTGVLEAHKGTDIAAPTGTEVLAVADGTVIESNYNNSCGYHIIIDHGDGIKTYYYHASQLKVKKGDEVKAGDVIMLVGSTGESTGPHLHIGVTINNEWVNPMDYSFKNE